MNDQDWDGRVPLTIVKFATNLSLHHLRTLMTACDADDKEEMVGSRRAIDEFTGDSCRDYNQAAVDD